MFSTPALTLFLSCYIIAVSCEDNLTETAPDDANNDKQLKLVSTVLKPETNINIAI